MNPRFKAEERAKSLLLQHLTPYQRKTWETKGYFDFKGSGGLWFRILTMENAYRITRSPHHNLLVLGSETGILRKIKPTLRDGVTGIARNLYSTTETHDSYLPEGDNVLAIKLTLEVHQEMFRNGCTMPYQWKENLLGPNR